MTGSIKSFMYIPVSLLIVGVISVQKSVGDIATRYLLLLLKPNDR